MAGSMGGHREVPDLTWPLTRDVVTNPNNVQGDLLKSSLPNEPLVLVSEFGNVHLSENRTLLEVWLDFDELLGARLSVGYKLLRLFLLR
jgi:hypothetical protein